MLEKLENLENRFKELSDLMIKPEILSDQKQYIKLSKEYKELKKIIDKGQGYKSILSNISEAQEIISNEKDEEMLEIAKRLEEIALQDPYFIEKKLYPNVDFYSGIILKALGIPTSMFTVIFAIGRTVGWIAHWNEMISGSYRIGRPRQLYTGYPQRDYVPLDER